MSCEIDQTQICRRDSGFHFSEVFPQKIRIPFIQKREIFSSFHEVQNNLIRRFFFVIVFVFFDEEIDPIHRRIGVLTKIRSDGGFLTSFCRRVLHGRIGFYFAFFHSLSQ